MNMNFEDRRMFHRVNFDGLVDLEFNRQSYDCCEVKDLSLTGMYVLGKICKRQFSNCFIRLFHKEKSGNNCVRALAEVIWSNDSGVGLRFTGMTFANYMLLQTTLIDKAEQPEIILREFPRDFPFEITSM